MHQPALFKSGDLATGVMERLDKLDALFGSAKSKIETIRNSGTFTTKGKQAAIADLKLEIDRDLKDWFAVEKGYADQIRQLREAMQPTEHRRDDVVYALEQREIRDYLRQLDPLDLEAFVREAAETGNDKVLSAVTNSPIPFRLATAGLINKIENQRLEQAHPEQAAKVKDLLTAQEQVGSALKSVHAELAREGLEIDGQALSLSDAA
jgi:hypothetical protein